MTWDQIIGLSIALLIMLVGVAGCLLPALPSTPIVLGAAVLHRIWFGEASASWLVLGLMVGLTLIAMVLDYVASVYGAKRLGATWRGMVGAVVGALVGLFFSLPGIILGPFIGAAGFEMLGGRKSEEAIRAGAGAVIGIFVGAVGKLACCVAMMALFAVSVVNSSVALAPPVVEPTPPPALPAETTNAPVIAPDTTVIPASAATGSPSLRSSPAVSQ